MKTYYKLHLHQARELYSNLGRKTDAFVLIKPTYSKHIHQSRIFHKSASPIWDEWFYVEKDEENCAIKFQVFNWSKIGSDNKLGTVTVDMAELDAQGLVWCEMKEGAIEVSVEIVERTEISYDSFVRFSVREYGEVDQNGFRKIFLPPPKISMSKSAKKLERIWLEEIEEVDVGVLQAGDVLIKKIYNEGSIVKTGQKLFNALRGSKYTTHAMLFVGDDDRILFTHASGTLGCVGTVEQLDEGYDFLVYRPKDPFYGAEAAKFALDVVENHTIKYSTANCLFATMNTSYGKQAKERHRKLLKGIIPSEMMCSEFISTCYQCMNDPYIKLDALHVSPIRLEDYINREPSLFTFLGRISTHPTQ